MEPDGTSQEDRIRRVLSGLSGGVASVRSLEALAALRGEILVQKEGAKRVREAGGLDRLVALLRKGSEKVQDVTLSALATCCLEEESCLTVGKLNVSVPLVSIVKTSSRDSVIGRACRLLGNLAQKQCNAESLHAAGAVTALLALLERRDSTTSYPTLTLLVRAIRSLWMVSEKRDDMLAAGAVRAIATLLAAECETAGIIKNSQFTGCLKDLNKTQEELLIGLLKCFGYFSVFTSVQCAEQMLGDGKGYHCLVALRRTHESTALKCLMNLCYVSSCRPDLGYAGFVECLVSILQKEDNTDLWPDGSATALAHLSEDSVNRSRLRHCGGLGLLLTAARFSHHALTALLQYIFDDTAFHILIEEGLVGILTDELVEHVVHMDCQHEYTDGKDKKRVEDTSTQKDESAGEQVEQRLASRAESNVVIERDNMLVGFIEDESEINEMIDVLPRLAKSTRKRRHKHTQKNRLERMTSLDWSAGIYWEHKSGDHTRQQTAASPPPQKSYTVYGRVFGRTKSLEHQMPTAASQPGSSASPERPYTSPNRSPWSTYSGRSPEHAGSSAQSKRPRWEWSPDSGLGNEGAASPWSGWSDRSPSSPFSASSDASSQGVYSPVCSETESEAEEANVKASEADAAQADDLNTSQVMQELDELIMDEDVDNPDQMDELNSKCKDTSSSSRISCVLLLLLRAVGASDEDRQSFSSSHLSNVLARADCLTALLDYIAKCRRPFGRAAKIMARVLSNAFSLMTVLRTRLALKLYKMSVSSQHPLSECRQCRQVSRLSKMLMSQLSKLAESEYGIGEVCYQLHKGTSSIQQTLSVTLPFCVKTHKPLRKYFIECSALNILVGTIEDGSESVENYVPALAKLAHNFKLRCPKILETNFTDQTQISYDPILDNLLEDEVVTFELDDASTVRANKTFLCQNSEVFCAMLSGQFKESNEKCVRLQKASKPAMEYMLTLLQCGINNPAQLDVQTFPLPEHLTTSLEVLLLSDRFLFRNIRRHLRSAIVQFQMCPGNVQDIYVWSQTDGMLELWTEAVCYVLVGEMSDSDRIAAFTGVLAMEYRHQWLNDVKSLIMQHASPAFREALSAW